jgi:hypothetical protein
MSIYGSGTVLRTTLPPEEVPEHRWALLEEKERARVVRGGHDTAYPQETANSSDVFTPSYKARYAALAVDSS